MEATMPTCCVCTADLRGEVRIARIARPDLLFCEVCGYRYLLKRRR
jgi:DNA-directed RNA polymerase subunit RPC12/RpoP